MILNCLWVGGSDEGEGVWVGEDNEGELGCVGRWTSFM